MKRTLRIAALCALVALAPVALYHGFRALFYAILFRDMTRGMEDAAALAEEGRIGLSGHESAEAVAAGPEGITLLLRTDPEGYTPEVWLQRLSWDGTPQWRRRLGAGQGSGRAIARVSGGFVVAGERQWTPQQFQAELLRVDTAGRVLRELRAGPRTESSFHSLAVLRDGSVLAGGSGGWTGLLVRTDSALRPVSEQRVDSVYVVAALAAAPSGGFASGALLELATLGVSASDLRAHDSAGRPGAAHRVPATGRAELVAVAALRDGGLLAAGDRADSARVDPRMWAARTDAAGRPVWERTLDLQSTAAAALLPDGGALLAGHSWLADTPRTGLVRLSPRGETLWSRTLRRGERDHVSGIVPAQGGGWVLAGGAYDGARKKYRVWVLRLDDAGNTLWERILPPQG